MHHKIKIPNRADVFIKDYRLPLGSTVGLVLILVLLLLLRTYENRIIAGVLGDSSKSENGYAHLLSKDKDAELKKNETDTVSETALKNPSSNTSTSLTINSGEVSTTPSAGGTTSPPSGGGSVEPPTQPKPFTAQIAGFGLRTQSGPLLCTTTSGGSGNQMCKQYDFVAGINTYNGPGNVSHKLHWQGVESGDSANSYLASTGDAFNQVNYSVKLRCDKPGQYFFKFFLVQPNAATSNEIPIAHSCGTTTPPPSGT